MNLQHYLFLFLRYSWLVILIIAASLAGMYAWLSKQSPVYASRAVLQVEMEQAKIVDIQDVKENRVTGADAINTVIQTLTSNNIMLAVAKSVGRDKVYAAQNGVQEITPEMESALAQSIRGQLSVTLRRGTQLIDIVAEDTDSAKAQKLASEVVAGFLKMQSQDRTDVSTGANAFLVSEVRKHKEKLEESERKVAEYRLSHKVVSVDEKQNIVVERLSELNGKVTAANTQKAALESDLAALKDIKSDDISGMLKLASVAALPEVSQLRAAVNSKEGEFAAIRERYLELHPKYKAALSALNEVKSKLATAVGSAGDTLRQQYNSFAETEQKLKDMLVEQEAETLQLDQLSIPYKLLQGEAKANREIYETVLNRLKETDVTMGLTKNPYRLVEKPLINPIPVRPNRGKSLLTAALLALAGGAGLVLLIDRMDSSIRTVDEAERELELPVLAAVPEADLSKQPFGGTALTSDPGGSMAEAFRTLRASLSLLGEEDQRRLILVTSAIPSEGKTHTSINLAAAFATQGLRTLLIDADLRRPALSATLIERDVRKGTEFRGLTDVLSSLCTTAEAIRPTLVDNLSLLPSGRRAPNPAELLAQGSVPKLLQQFIMDYDRVIIDSAPVNAVSDSLSLAPQAHAVCLVLRFGKTPRRAIQRALTLLQKSGARMAGLVMNRMPTSRGAAYYYYYYGDPYIANSVYGQGKDDDIDKPLKKGKRSQQKASV